MRRIVSPSFFSPLLLSFHFPLSHLRDCATSSFVAFTIRKFPFFFLTESSKNVSPLDDLFTRLEESFLFEMRFHYRAKDMLVASCKTKENSCFVVEN